MMVSLWFVACDIKEDFPDPIILGEITDFQVEGQCSADGQSTYVPTIDKESRMVTLYVNDTVDLTRLRIIKVAAAGSIPSSGANSSELPVIMPDEAAYGQGVDFPQHGFVDSIGDLDIRMDFTHPVKFVVRTYQDYHWTVVVHRVVKREIQVESQVGEAVIDPYLCNAIIYVASGQSLKNLKVHKFSLGGEHGTVTPDPTLEESSNFYDARQFEVKTGWGAIETWTVVVCPTDKEVEPESSLKVSAWSNFAVVDASVPVDEEQFRRSSLRVEWKVADDDWEAGVHVVEYYELNTENLDSVRAILKGLTPGTTYECRLCYEDGEKEIIGTSVTFTTEEQLVLYNGGFENWWVDGKIDYPNKSGFSYWDTSNPGGSSFGGSNTTATTSVVHSGDKAAKLESKYIVIKFAAASLYTGSFGQLIGTSGAKLNWGVPFTARPTALKGWMLYAPKAINRVGKNLPSDAPAEGEPDQCTMFCALLSEALVVDNTNMSTFPDWENDPRVIAYGSLADEQNVDSKGRWTRVSIPLVYRDVVSKPTHLLVVFSASKYGDYFHGGEGSTLYVDDFSLEYGDNPLMK
jgi:hypothetical protein